MASQLCSNLLASRAVGKRDMVIGNVVEEVDLALVQHKASSDGMNRCVAPSFVEEATIFVERLKEIGVSFASQPVKVADFEIGPEVAVVVGVAVVVTEKAQRVVLRNVLGVVLDEFLGAVP